MTKIVYITGATSGIGKAMVEQFAALGYGVGMVARRKELLKQIRSRLLDKEYLVEYAAADVCDEEALRGAFLKLKLKLGPCDILVANAGVGGSRDVDRFDIPVARRIIDTNYVGLMMSVAIVLPDMLARSSGHIVGISSLAAYVAYPSTYVYSASKAAVNIHLAGLKHEVKSRGITVSTICPGFIKTPLTDQNNHPMPFLMDVDVAAAKIIRAIEKKKRVYRFPWQLSWLIKLSKLVPFLFSPR